MTRFVSAALCSLLVAGCVKSPTSATPPPAAKPIAGIPTSLELTATPLFGANGGTADIHVRVLDAFSTAVNGATVTLQVSSGTVTPDSIVSNDEGRGTALMAASAGVVTLTATVNGQNVANSTNVSIQPALVVSTPTPNPPPAPPPGPSGPLNVSLSATTADLGYSTVFNAQVSGGVQASVAWTYGDGATFSGISTSSAHAYGAAGTYPASVRVIDVAGRSASASTTVTVRPEPPQPPPSYVLEMHAAPNPAAVGATVLVAVDITTKDGAVFPDTLKWDCRGNGTIDATTNGSHTFTNCSYAMAGTFNARVTVSGGSVTGTATIPIVVR